MQVSSANQDDEPVVENANVAVQVELGRPLEVDSVSLETKLEDITIEMSLLRKRTARELQDLLHLLREQEAELKERGGAPVKNQPVDSPKAALVDSLASEPAEPHVEVADSTVDALRVAEPVLFDLYADSGEEEQESEEKKHTKE
eukprot:2981216-Amphidinium_carterae.1